MQTDGLLCYVHIVYCAHQRAGVLSQNSHSEALAAACLRLPPPFALPPRFFAGFAAAASCLMVGDELIGVNGERVLNYDQTIYALRSAAAGEVRLRIIRRGGVTQAVAHAVIAEAVVV